MKKILILTLALLTLTLPALAENTYALTTIVLEVMPETDEVVCIDFNGNIWVFYGSEDWLVGDVATLTMSNSDSNSIIDDEIIDTQYNGWFSPEMIDHWLSHE